MSRSSNVFSTLAAKAQRGDATAKTQLHRQLEPQMLHIVRLVIREGRGRTALDRRILAEASRVGLSGKLQSPEERERLIRSVAQNLCSSVVSQLRTTTTHASEDTVCDSGISVF